MIERAQIGGVERALGRVEADQITVDGGHRKADSFHSDAGAQCQAFG